MATYHKDSGTFEVDAYHKTAGRWTKRGFKQKDQAEAAQAYWKATGQVPPWIGSAVSKDTFEDVAKRFHDKNPKWFEGRNGSINAQRFDFAVLHLGKLPVDAIRKRELEDFVDKVEKQCGRAGQPPANSTVNRYLDAVSKVLTYAHSLDLIQGTPAFPRRDNSDGEKRGALTWAQEDIICGTLEARGEAVEAFLIRILCATGMRAGELFAITASQIETPEQEENCGISLRGDQTKNGHPRWVPLVLEACKKLREIIRAGRRPIQHNLYEAMKRAVREAREDTRISPHWCRHTANTRMLDASHAHLQVQQILGHLEGSMSQLYYHPEKAKLFSVAEKVQGRVRDFPKKSGIVQLNPAAKRAESA
jgi:integrase